MANEVATRKGSFSELLTTELEQNTAALPANFNISRYVKNSIALLNGNDALKEFNRKYGNEQIRLGLLTAAYSGLDASRGECYLIPYASQINFVASWKGMMQYAKRNNKMLHHFKVGIIHEGDVFEYGSKNGDDFYDHKITSVGGNKRIVGAYANCTYSDGHNQLEVMSIEELEAARSQSKAKNGTAWAKFQEEMFKKVVMRRLCKRILTDENDDFDRTEDELILSNGIDIETDTKELSKREIAAGENSEDFIEADAKVVM